MMAAHPSTPSTSLPMPGGVRRALDAMRANVERDWSIDSLADIACISSRTLQRQFQAFLGKTPLAALRDMRFERARRELLKGSPDATVIDIALGCGLTHSGRFSVDYRRRYGETPTQTQKRQAIFAGALAAMPSFVGSTGGQLKVTLGPIDASPENREIGRHLEEELATALMRAGLSVVTGPRAAPYFLCGSITGLGRQARLSLRLIESETGHHLSAYRSNGAIGDDAISKENLAVRIAAALQPPLRHAEIERADRKPESDLTPHDLAFKALPNVLSLDADGNARAIDSLERAMHLDPNHALATALAAWAYGQRVVYHFAKVPMQDRTRSAELARKAQSLAAGNSTVLAVLGNALTLLHDLEAAGQVVGNALAIDGGSAWAWSRGGWIDVYNGDSESAIERFKIALDLAPNDPLAFNTFVGLGCAHFGAARYAEAARWQQRALAEHPSAIWIHRTMCPAYVLSGAYSEARHSISALLSFYPELTMAEVQRGFPPMTQDYRDLAFDALHTIGLPS